MADRLMNKVLLVVAVSLGVLFAYVDTRPTWNDTGVMAGAILIACGALGLAEPKRPWLWALAVGLWIPLVEIAQTRSYGSLLALVVAFAGAYTGMACRKFGPVLFPLFLLVSGIGDVRSMGRQKPMAFVSPLAQFSLDERKITIRMEREESTFVQPVVSPWGFRTERVASTAPPRGAVANVGPAVQLYQTVGKGFEKAGAGRCSDELG
ncbi:MAG: hypothetical protein NVSMB9_05140 [Isosphaeraceae bacterium]